MGKKAASKTPVSKLVWQWAETVSPENITEELVRTAYRLGLPNCENCRKNCPGNPTCLRGIGESSWLKPGNYKNYLDDEIKELENDVRKDGEFVGLRNLGATCYVNTFLQLWFHNLSFREAVYNYKGDAEDGKFPSTPCGHLQLLFGMMQSSMRKNIDPSPFVKCLGLDTDLQQDAQEFSKLLLNLLDRTSEVGNFLCEEFCGEYDYCTTCKVCGNVSRRPSKFYELDLSIQGKKDAGQCLEEFFKEEQLDKENQYHCANCNQKCDATRRIVIKSFPRTLNLQLLRFVFDKTTWNKKKLSSFLSFPDTLNMSKYISSNQAPQESTVYQLTAVLIHRGPSAFSGHYIAHIKDSSTELWHKFNDEAIEQVKSGKKLDLDALTNDDYEVDMPAPAKKPKVSKNTHTSKDAYMLVYTRKVESDTEKTLEIPKIPPIAQEAVWKDNEEFKSTINTLISDTQRRVDEKSKNHSQMGVMLKMMYDIKREELIKDCYWVPITWLKHMLNGTEEEKRSFSTEKFQCSHGKLNPDKVGMMKCIPGEVGNFLFALCKEDIPKITNEMLCLDCVKHKCLLLRLKASLKEDHALVTKLVKENESSIVDGFLIGRSSLRYWKTMALKKTEVVENEEDASKASKENSDKREAHPVDDVDQSSDEEFDFNEDLLCEHGKLTTDAKLYRIIPDLAWNIIIKYFHGAPTFQSSMGVCQICRDDEYDAAQAAELEKVLITEQRNRLNNLFFDKKRPSHEDLFELNSCVDEDCPSFYGVSSKFVQKWREHIQNSSKNDAVSQVQNEILLCPHRRLICDPALAVNKEYQLVSGTEENEPFIVLLWSEEWDYISKNFGVDVPISVTKRLTQPENPKMINGSCDSDQAQRLQISHPTQDSNHNGKGITAAERLHNLVPNEHITANIIAIDDNPSEKGKKIELVCDPELCRECIEGKELEKERNLRTYENKEIFIRKVISDAFSTWMTEPESESSKGSARRSKRAHTVRGEKKAAVSSTWTLKQLKIKMMQMYSIPPFDQNIYLKGKKLEDDSMTLGELFIIPGSTIYLLADEPDEKALEMLPVVPQKQAAMEEGFKGTSLLGT